MNIKLKCPQNEIMTFHYQPFIASEENLDNLKRKIKELKNREIEVLKQEKENILNEKESLQIDFENFKAENEILKEGRLRKIAGLETSLNEIKKRLHKTQGDVDQMYITASINR